MSFDVTITPRRGRVTDGKRFDFRAYMERRRGKPADETPCYESPTRCSGCPFKRDGEVCWTWARRGGR